MPRFAACDFVVNLSQGDAVIYLDNAATTYPKPPSVYERTFQWMRESGGNPERGTHALASTAGRIIEDTRRQMARLFGVADPRRVVFTYNCTDSVNMVLKGLLSPGDHVVTSALDHNAVSRPLERLRREGGIAVTRLPFDADGFVDPDRVRESIVRSTKIIVLCHGSNVLGSVQPIGPFVDLSVSTGVPLLIDAAQTAGRLPVESGDAPVFVACSAHKGLYGMPGLGILAVPAGIELRNWREGGTGTASESLEHPADLPMRLEAGTPNFLSIASLHFALEFLKQQGIESIHRKELDLALALHDFLASDSRFSVYSALRKGTRTAVVSFNLRNAAPEEVAVILDQRFDIAVRSGLHCAAVLHEQLGTMPGGCVRVSPGYFNTPDDIAALIDALKTIADGYSE